jgi:serine/threonine-protein kinase
MRSQTYAEARIGSRIGGKYLLQRLLGCGGMGAVYLGENTWLKRPVAVKVLHPDLADHPEVINRFLQEAQTASQLRHPNIVDVLDLGQDPRDEALYIVQEFLDGGDLRGELDARGRLPAAEAAEIALPLMGALAVAHRRGVVHRDIKPENILLVRDETGDLSPKLIDFGISKIISESQDKRNLTQSGTIVGTPNYMSPEQSRGEPTLDGRTDVWSLGVVLYEMLAGRCPFDAPNQNVLMLKIITEEAPRIEQFAPEVPSDLADVLHMALVSDREGRFADMDSFIAAFIQTECGSAIVDRHRRSLVTVAGLGAGGAMRVGSSPSSHPPVVTPARLAPRTDDATTQRQLTPTSDLSPAWEDPPTRLQEVPARALAPPGLLPEGAANSQSEGSSVVTTPLGWPRIATEQSPDEPVVPRRGPPQLLVLVGVMLVAALTVLGGFAAIVLVSGSRSELPRAAAPMQTPPESTAVISTMPRAGAPDASLESLERSAPTPAVAPVQPRATQATLSRRPALAPTPRGPARVANPGATVPQRFPLPARVAPQPPRAPSAQPGSPQPPRRQRNGAPILSL